MNIKKTSIVLVLTLMLSGCLFLASPSSADAQTGGIACSLTSLFGSGAGAAGSLSSKVPVADSQVQGNTGAVKNIDCTWKGIAWQLAHTVLHSLTGSVVNWINSGFQGSPAFLTNPKGYFTDLGDQLTGQFISNTGVLSALCSPFSVDVRLALALGQVNGDSGRYTCTLSSIINNVKNSTINGMSIGGFMNGDFSQGGWPAFMALSQPQNNEGGAYLQAHSDLLNRISGKQNTVNAQLNQGGGFLTYPVCKDISSESAYDAANSQGISPDQLDSMASSNGSASQHVGAGSSAMDTSTWYAERSGSITVKTDSKGNLTYQSCQDVTPGSVIQGSLTKTLGASADELNMTNDINQIVSALFSQLLSKTLQGGLFSASQSSSGNSNLGSITAQLIQDQQGQANSTALQGQIVEQIQSTASSVEQAITYRSQILTAITAEQKLYQNTRACMTRNGSSYGYNQSQLNSIDATIADINKQVSDAQTNLDTASSSLPLYQNAINQIKGASSLSQANDLSNQLTIQLSSLPNNGATDPSAAQSDLTSTLNEIATLETARQPYQTICNGQ